jgi:hypothetical protein
MDGVTIGLTTKDILPALTEILFLSAQAVVFTLTLTARSCSADEAVVV